MEHDEARTWGATPPGERMGGVDSQRPIASGGNGRGTDGRFQPGNTGGPGNPYARQVAALRAAIMEAATPEALREVVRKLVEKAQEGHLPAIRELLDRTLGKPVEADLIVRLEQLEQTLARVQGAQRR